MLTIPRQQRTYRFSPDTPPVARVRPGERLVVETDDASTGRVHRREDVPVYARVRDPREVNPATGPIYVEGAEPGDDLVVLVERIDLAPQGFVRTSPGAGVLQAGITAPDGVIVRVEGDTLDFGGGLRLPARPMVGVVGTAPAVGAVLTGAPGPQGSNLDVNAIAPGARVHLPVHVPGALLALGDVHASMGDGEVCGTGVEIPAAVTLWLDLAKGEAPRRPWVETPDGWATTGSGVTLEDAVEVAVEGLVELLVKRLSVDRTLAFMLVSARGDVRIGQCARIPGLAATAYATFPRVG